MPTVPGTLADSLAAVVKVLVVEDSAVLAERLTDIVATGRFKVVGVVDSESEAVSLVTQASVDVVLLDLQLKRGTGFGVLRAMETMTRKPFVVVLTNHDLPEYHQAALHFGATEFVDKARAFHRLPQILNEYLSTFDRE